MGRGRQYSIVERFFGRRGGGRAPTCNVTPLCANFNLHGLYSLILYMNHAVRVNLSILDIVMGPCQLVCVFFSYAMINQDSLKNSHKVGSIVFDAQIKSIW